MQTTCWHEYISQKSEPPFHLQQLEGQQVSPCIMCVQYIGGCSVHWGDIMSTSRGYHEYIGDIMMNVGDTMSTSEDVQYIGGMP